MHEWSFAVIDIELSKGDYHRYLFVYFTLFCFSFETFFRIQFVQQLKNQSLFFFILFFYFYSLREDG